MSQKQIDIKLNFAGGPLDGSERRQRIPADWAVIRYEHRPRVDAAIRHVYSGQRQPGDRQVQLQYIGAQPDK